MTKTEQDRLNAAIKTWVEWLQSKGVTYDCMDDAPAENVWRAAQPLMEKEPRVGYVPEMEDGEVLVHEDGSPANSYKAIELMDTPYIVQKGRKPYKLSQGLADHVRLRVNCDD